MRKGAFGVLPGARLLAEGAEVLVTFVNDYASEALMLLNTVVTAVATCSRR